MSQRQGPWADKSTLFYEARVRFMW